MLICRLSGFNTRPVSSCLKTVDIYFTFQNTVIDTDTMIAWQRSTHRCTPHTVSSRRFNSFLHFYLCFSNHSQEVGFQCQHSQIVSRAEISLGDKPATHPRSQLEYFHKSFAGKSSNFAIDRKHPGLNNNNNNNNRV